MYTKRLCVLNRVPVSKKRGSAAKDERWQYLKEVLIFFSGRVLRNCVFLLTVIKVYVCVTVRGYPYVTFQTI